jgi:hypothetical protein
MAELSLLWETVTGTGDSDTGGYTDSQLFQMFRSLFSRTANLGGVSPDYQNELEVTGTSSPVAVNTGAALVHGIPYWNTASVNVTVATPAAQTRIDRIVLRADWGAQTVRITRIAGTEGGVAPALTQSAGVTWDIPLATVSVTTGGVITVTDAREWLGGIGDGTVDSSKLAADAVTTAKIADANVTNAKIANMAANTVKANNTDASATPSDVDIATLLAAYIHAATDKSPLSNNDELLVLDSDASNVLKKILYSELAAMLGGVTTGSFTPGLTVGGSATGITFNVQRGSYFKISTFVFYHIEISLTSKGSNSGALKLTGLPFTSVATLFWPAAKVAWNSGNANLYDVLFYVDPGTSTGELFALTAGATNIQSAMTAAQIANNASFIISGWYQTT